MHGRSHVCVKRELSSSARRICRSMRATCRATTKSLAQLTILTICRALRAAHRADRPPLWHADLLRWNSAATSAVRFVCPLICRVSSAISLVMESCRRMGRFPDRREHLRLADLAVAGPMARTVEDLKLGLDIMGGPNRWEHPAWRLRLPPPRHRTLKQYRVAAWLDDPACRVEPEVRDLLGKGGADARRRRRTS